MAVAVDADDIDVKFHPPASTRARMESIIQLTWTKHVSEMMVMT